VFDRATWQAVDVANGVLSAPVEARVATGLG
jgi:hypothetical protein